MEVIVVLKIGTHQLFPYKKGLKSQGWYETSSWLSMISWIGWQDYSTHMVASMEKQTLPYFSAEVSVPQIGVTFNNLGHNHGRYDNCDVCQVFIVAIRVHDVAIG